jgi:hypothetical protein
MNIAIGTYGDPFSLKKELVIDSFNHTFVDGVSGVGKSTLEDALASIFIGKAYGRNQRARRALAATPPETVPPAAVPGKTAAQSIHSLDAQFPWAARRGKVTPSLPHL